MNPERSRTILIVDDDADLRDALQEVLEDEGYRVATAADGRKALDYLRASPAPGLILLDLMMPVMDGWQFREAQARDPALAAIPVLVMTAFRDQSMSREAADVVFKPIQLEALLQRIEEYLGPPPSDRGSAPLAPN